MKEHVIEVRGLELAVAEAGIGGVPLLLLHGFTGAKEDFTEWLDRLADLGFHAVAADHRGHGASSAPADEAVYSIAELATDCLALADELGWDRFALLGHSMGGMVAQTMALRAPQRIERLVLMDTHHGLVPGIDAEMHDLGVSIVRDQGIAGLMEILATVETNLATSADARLRQTRPGYVEFCDRKLAVSSPAMWTAMSTELLRNGEDRLDALRSLAVRTLVLVGDQDADFVPASERMAEAIPGARLVVIPDAGHSPQFEAPEPWWHAVSTFLREP
ncbi:MAG: putative hydrolase or acyltransferase of alpha/beta superfamily [Acidimicrobiales bacterium]|nr:putative hydrolase or acyltransferase of alpha/beta superfamily [Acidimicrobiales bacterium]